MWHQNALLVAVLNSIDWWPMACVEHCSGLAIWWQWSGGTISGSTKDLLDLLSVSAQTMLNRTSTWFV